MYSTACYTQRPAPAYIPVEAIASSPIAHSWDDWDPYVLVGEPDDRVVERLQQVSLRARLAYALGCSEWICYRLQRHSLSLGPCEYVDATWARLLRWELGYVW